MLKKKADKVLFIGLADNTDALITFKNVVWQYLKSLCWEKQVLTTGEIGKVQIILQAM